MGISGSVLQRRFLPIMLAGIILSGCPKVQLISNYDPVLDQQATELHWEMERFFVRMGRLAGTEKGQYSANLEFYDETLAFIEILKERAKVQPKNAETVGILDGLTRNVERLRVLHKDGREAGLPKADIESSRNAIRVQFSSLIKLELAKQRGEKAN
jgi:hypothetical protein